ncbi:MAG: SDR family oxidoreductase [Gammaproteobacteria bacterium]
MNGQVVWLTGCASGVGLHLADVFLARGARVVATDVDLDGLRHAARANNWDAGRVLLRRLDVRDRSAWDGLYTELMGAWGRLDLLFNVAGIIHPGRLAEAAEEDLQLHFDINFKGLVNGCQVAARHMRAQGRGHIVNLSSLAGVAAIPGIGLYSASKHAVRAYSLVLAEELRDSGVAVTVICPDAIETPMLVLQEDFEEAAMTFSGSAPLTVKDISRVVFGRVLKDRPVEVGIPPGRSFLARLAGAFPAVSRLLTRVLRRRGLRTQQERRRRRGLD